MNDEGLLLNELNWLLFNNSSGWLELSLLDELWLSLRVEHGLSNKLSLLGWNLSNWCLLDGGSGKTSGSDSSSWQQFSGFHFSLISFNVFVAVPPVFFFGNNWSDFGGGHCSCWGFNNIG